MEHSDLDKISSWSLYSGIGETKVVNKTYKNIMTNYKYCYEEILYYIEIEKVSLINYFSVFLFLNTFTQ